MTIDEAIQLALKHLQSGNLTQAEVLLNEILSISPDNVNALHFLGIICYEMKNYDKAIGFIEKAVELNPAYADAYNNLGLALQEKGRINEAIMCYQKALDLRPDFKSAYNNLSNLLIDTGYFQKAVADSATMRNAISSANVVRKSIGKLISGGTYTAISLGQSCSTAWYLKQVGAKTESYPFDWIFSSAEIATACLRDEFSIFLDKRYILEKQDWRSAGHSVYHANMFHHRNPLLSEENYDYYVRCVDRFRRILSSGASIVFVCTIIKESEKNLAWSSGFCHEYLLPTAQSHQIYESFMECVRKINQHIKYIFIEQYTEGSLSLASEMISDDVLSIAFTSHGKSDGVKYLNDFDDFIAKLLFSGLIE